MHSCCYAIIVLAATAQMAVSEERVGRSDVRAVLGDASEPGFWPTRGRRGQGSEETPPPFWAHRGRSQGEVDEGTGVGAPGFWAHRGRDNGADCSDTLTTGRLYAEEPHWVLIQRRDAENADPFWVARGRRQTPHHR